MHKINLGGQWKLYAFPQHSLEIGHPDDLASKGLPSIPAQVPGNVELDLLAAGQIPDPYVGSNIKILQQYELYEWWYETSFPAPAQHGRTELVFHGADCLATYWLNGVELGSSDNMLISHTFDITSRLVPGENKLHVRLRSPIIEAMNKEYDPSMWAMEYNWAQLWVRKAAHGFGWDIMPRAVSAGLWRDVELVIHDAAEIRDMYFFTRAASEGHANVGIYYQLHVNPALLGALTLRIVGRCGDAEFHREARIGFSAGSVDLSIHGAKLWWPRGYGQANVYDVTTTLLHNGTVLAERTDTFGIRTVELLRTQITSAENPGQFQFRVNGVPVFAKGSNWVPADMFHSKDKARIPAILDLFADMNCNIVRIWGGSVYEDHDFFERCDREGFMVWQDFSFACALYPQTEEFYEAVRTEARFIVRKLRNHPSLVLWCGDNEIDAFSHNRTIRPANNKISREVLPAVVQQCDPYRPYLESSPYVPDEVWRNKDMSLLPEEHLWGPRDYFKSKFYSGSKMHFISEIGYHGCPSPDSIRRFIDKEHLWPFQNNEQWAYHSSDPIGLEGIWASRIGLMADQVKEMFGIVPDNLDDFALASQISQAEAKKYFVEMMRIKKGLRSGIIWWNMMDGWPQFSDAVVDYYFNKKVAYYYLKNVHQDICIMIDEPADWHVRAVVSNDTLQAKQGTFRIWDADSGADLLKGEFYSHANGNADLGRIRISHSEQRLFVIEWTIEGKSYRNHYLLGFPGFSLDAYKKWLPLLQPQPQP